MRILTVQEQAARLTLEGMESLFRAARHVPETNLRWSPMGAARSVMSQVAECAVAPRLQIQIIEGAPEEAVMDAYHANLRDIERLMQGTLDQAYAVAVPQTQALARVLRSYPSDRLEEERILPFNGGMTRTQADLLFIPYWNLCYHIGQINYIQTLLGDTEMRM
jgi:hypothetical protein